MKKLVNSIFILIFIVLAATSMWYNTSGYITNKNWKYYDGVSIGDMVETFLDANGEINIESERPAELVFCFNKFLVVRNQSDRKFGYYIQKKGFD